MRRLPIGAAISLAVVTSAAAADLPVYPRVPADVAPFNWWGLYAGGSIGYGWGRSDTTATLNDPKGVGIALATANTRFSLNGAIGGGQIGYNLQAGQWVFGIEADLQGSRQSGSTSFVCPTGTCAKSFGGNPGGPVTATLSEELTWMGTVRGRVGLAVVPTVLGYFTGGLAYGGVRTNATFSGTNFPVGGPPAVPVAGTSSTISMQFGWTLGGGIETALGNSWTGKIEYLYVDLGTVLGGPLTTPIVAPSGTFLTGNFSSHMTDNILRAGLNYRF